MPKLKEIVVVLGALSAFVWTSLQIYQWFRSPSQNLVATVTVVPFAVPPTVTKQLDALSPLSDGAFGAAARLGIVTVPEAADSESTEKLLQSISKFVNNAAPYIRRPGRELWAEGFMSVVVENDGTKAAEDVSLTLPFVSLASVDGNTEPDTTVKGFATTVRLGTMQPRGRVLLKAWTSTDLSRRPDADDFQLTHREGVGGIAISAPSNSMGRRVGNFYEFVHENPVYIAIMLLFSTSSIWMKSLGAAMARFRGEADSSDSSE